MIEIVSFSEQKNISKKQKYLKKKKIKKYIDKNIKKKTHDFCWKLPSYCCKMRPFGVIFKQVLIF